MSVAAPEPSAPFGHWAGGQITEHAHCLLQGNPGPMTLDGTNTWVLMSPGGSDAIVIDPGEDEAAHQQRVVEHVAGLGARVTRIVLTHGHADHSEGAPRLARLTGAPVQAVGRGHDDLSDGEISDEVIGECEIVVSELVTNAIRHAKPLPDGSIRVHWKVRAPRVEVEVGVRVPSEAVGAGVTAAPVRVDGPVERHRGGAGHVVQGGLRVDLVEGHSGELGRRDGAHVTRHRSQTGHRIQTGQGRGIHAIDHLSLPPHTKSRT